MKRGTTRIMTTSITSSSATTKAAVITDSSQLLSIILSTAHTAIIGALMMSCRPIAMTICTCVMSLVVRFIKLGTEKLIISCWPKSAILLNTRSRIVSAKPAATFAVK